MKKKQLVLRIHDAKGNYKNSLSIPVFSLTCGNEFCFFKIVFSDLHKLEKIEKRAALTIEDMVTICIDLERYHVTQYLIEC